MKISYNWLKEYIATELSAEEMAEILTDTGLEVEGLHKIEAVQGGLKGVVIGEVLSCEKHPDADRLKVTTVNIGEGDPLQIVCGAPNVAAGQKVVVATVGTTLFPQPDEPFKIKKSKIRGVESVGMLCAEDELGLGASHEGILVLNENATVGQQASKFFELEDDYELEIGLTPNRADAMGHIGVARDLVAYLNAHKGAGVSINWPDVSDFKVDNNSLNIAIEVENDELCPRYMGTSIKGVNVQTSPSWLQKKLRAIGLSPINNVVDVTNMVMHELGTPLHAFDADQLHGKIVVRTAKKGEKFTTLDEVERELDESNLMITNGKESLCIAGVFGGVDSGIKDTTKNVFLESAYFNPVSIRKTAKMHGLNTDASFRYERGVDPNLTDYALKRAALLIKEIAGGEIAMDVVDTNSHPIENKQVKFSYDRCYQLIGHKLDDAMTDTILENLDIKILERSGRNLLLEIPAYRVDVAREADVVEEILRIYGFNNVPLPKKLNSSLSFYQKPDREKVQTVISEMMVGMGFVETLNNSLTKSKYAEQFNGTYVKPETAVEILNPLSQDLDVMRQSLVFNAMEMVEHNQNRQHPDLKLFEFGKVYHKYGDKYSENKRLMVVLSGQKQAENWNSSKESATYYTMKGVANAILTRLGLDGMMKEKSSKNDLFEDGVQWFVLKQKIGDIGWASPKLRKYFGVKNDVFIADLDWDALIDCLKYTKVKFTELPKTFAVRRDFSLLLDEGVKFSEIEEVARSSDKQLLQEVGLFDVYEGKNLEKGKKSYAVSFKFQDPEKTLKDQQIDAIMDKIRKGLEDKLGAQLR